MQVLQLVEANLLAAYALNLMGIICVAVVKIGHVRNARGTSFWRPSPVLPWNHRIRRPAPVPNPFDAMNRTLPAHSPTSAAQSPRFDAVGIGASRNPARAPPCRTAAASPRGDLVASLREALVQEQAQRKPCPQTRQ